ncbi:MAG: type VI secretion system baseplate subunit TssF [Phycisphaerales bacterium]
MDRRLLRYYNRELLHIRDAALEFAQEYPKIAGRLGLDTAKADECADPYVERLLEGFAFLAARVQLKLDAEFPRFTQSLLETVYPHYLAPTPSMAVVRFQPDTAEGGLASGLVVKRDRALRSTIGKGEQTACEYRTAHDLTLWPLQIESVEYFTRNLAAVSPPRLPNGQPIKAAIRIRLRSTAGLTFNKLALDRLTFHLLGADETPGRAFEQVLAHTVALAVQPVRTPLPWQHVVEPPCVARVGFDDEHALLPYGTRSFHGHRLVHEYFSLPQRFLFFEVAGLAPGVKRCDAAQLDLVLLLDAVDLELETALTAANVQLFCTPAINLFPKRCDRIQLSERTSEFQVIPDRTRPLDFEVYQVLGVSGYREGSEVVREFRPFYSATDYEDEGRGGGAYFSVNRVPRAESTREQLQGRRSSYAGSEVYLSLVDAHAAPWSEELRQLGVEARCTNRDLPLRMPVGRGRTDFSIEEGAPIESIRVVTGPTRPVASFAEGEVAWRAVSHLALNSLSLADSGAGQGAAALRDLLRLYGDATEAHIRKQIEGVRTIAHKAITRRVAAPGPIAFARGLEVSVTFDDPAFEGVGPFVLGAVLDHFFARYVSINSFTETVVRTASRGEIMRWAARVGQRHIL